MRMTDISTHEFEDDFLKEVDRGETIVAAMIHAAIKTHPDAYPYTLKMLNAVLIAGIDADTIGESEASTLRAVGDAIKRELTLGDPPSAGFITAV
jgi:hypothetical protein